MCGDNFNNEVFDVIEPIKFKKICVHCRVVVNRIPRFKEGECPKALQHKFERAWKSYGEYIPESEYPREDDFQ